MQDVQAPQKRVQAISFDYHWVITKDMIENCLCSEKNSKNQTHQILFSNSAAHKQSLLHVPTALWGSPTKLIKVTHWAMRTSCCVRYWMSYKIFLLFLERSGGKKQCRLTEESKLPRQYAMWLGILTRDTTWHTHIHTNHWIVCSLSFLTEIYIPRLMVVSHWLGSTQQSLMFLHTG